jgi:hypothetical protein
MDVMHEIKMEVEARKLAYGGPEIPVLLCYAFLLAL